MIKHVHLEKNGIELFIGPLEAQILRILWNIQEPITVTRLHNLMILNGSNAAFSTVHTTVVRMADKGLVLPITKPRHKVKYWQAVTNTEADFILYCVTMSLNRIRNEYPNDVADWIVA